LENRFVIEDLRALHKRYFPLLTAYARSIISSHEDAKEIVQDVFISMWKNKDTIDKSRNLEAYLTRAVKNRCINYFKLKKKRTVDVDSLIDVKGHHINVTEQMELAEMRLWIYKAIDDLPPKCREIFLMSRDKQLSYKEIALELNISRKTVENQISIALKKLRIVMKGWEGHQNE
jgi:RNA polymerase sigma-70 factor (ECF subfamily)